MTWGPATVELDPREKMHVQAALAVQIRYTRGLATRGKDPEAVARNIAWTAELVLLAEKFQ